MQYIFGSTIYTRVETHEYIRGDELGRGTRNPKGSSYFIDVFLLFLLFNFAPPLSSRCKSVSRLSICCYLCVSDTIGKEMVDYIADYLQNIRQRRVFPDVKPGYIRNLLPEQAPELGEDWDTIFADVERVVMPGVSDRCSYYLLYILL